MPDATVRLCSVADRQWGVIARWQLADCGLTPATMTRWIAAGRLHRLHQGVYAVGHRALAVEGQLTAALLYAGRGAALSHATAAWWWGLVDEQPAAIELSAPGRRRSSGSVCVHHPRRLQVTRHRRLPVTPVAQALIDLAASAQPDRVRRVLAEADYRGLLDLRDVQAVLGRGRAGSASLSEALRRHQPRLALTRSVLEVRFLALCEGAGIPMPEVNATVEGLMVDALWRGHGVVVELDGLAAHRTRAQIERDHGRDLRLRAAGFIVVRYTWAQITRRSQLVIADLRARLGL